MPDFRNSLRHIHRLIQQQILRNNIYNNNNNINLQCLQQHKLMAKALKQQSLCIHNLYINISNNSIYNNKSVAHKSGKLSLNFVFSLKSTNDQIKGGNCMGLNRNCVNLQFFTCCWEISSKKVELQGSILSTFYEQLFHT